MLTKIPLPNIEHRANLITEFSLFVQIDKHVLDVGKVDNNYNFIAVVVLFARTFDNRWLNVTACAVCLSLQFEIDIVEKLADILQQGVLTPVF